MENTPLSPLTPLRARQPNKKRGGSMPTFYDFVISRYLGKNSRLGDLAEDMKNDSRFPRGETNRGAIKHYLICCGACNDCIDTFLAAWRNYKRSVRS